MARQLRIEYPGAIYHVLSRGNGRQDIFRSNDDRYLFLGLLEEFVDRFNIEVHAYVLMGNHYHILLKTSDANLSKAMQWLGTSYTRKFNIIHNASGHLFQGRYKGIIIENDAYLMQLSYYIHRNPLRAGITERLTDYPWSSYRYYAYKKKAPEWLTTKTILNQYAGKNPKKAYRDKIQQYSDEQRSILEDLKHGFIYGSQEFVADLKSRFIGNQKDAELTQQNRLLRINEPELLLKDASTALGFDLEAARRAKKITFSEKEKRDMLMYLLWKSGHLSNREIGTLLGVTYSTVSKAVSVFGDKLRTEKTLRMKFEDLNSQFKV